MVWIKYGLANAVVILSALIHSTAATECSHDSYYTTVSSQEQLDTLIANCTIWTGDIIIHSTWNGPFVMNNIENITGLFTTATWDEYGYQGSALLTTIEAPELKYLESLHIWSVSNLTTVSLPKLEQTYLLSVEQSGESEVHLDVPSLLNITDKLEMLGNIPKVSFPSLIETGAVRIAGDGSLLDRFSHDIDLAFPGMAVDFPVLEQAKRIQIIGNISSIQMPSLLNLSDNGYDKFLVDKWILKLWTAGSSLDVTLPSLWNVSDISLSGTVDNFSFPALQSMNGIFQFKPTHHVTFDAQPLRRAMKIDLGGNVTSYALDSLSSLAELNIYPEQVIDCKPAAEAWKRLHPEDMDRGEQERWYYDSKLTCNGDIPRGNKPFPTVAVGLSVGIGIPVWVFFMFALWHSRKAKKKAEEVAKIPPPDYETEMAARSAGGGEALPDYEPRMSQGSRGNPGSDIELADLTRPTPYPVYPPGYDAAVSENVRVETANDLEVPPNNGTVRGSVPRTGAEI